MPEEPPWSANTNSDPDRGAAPIDFDVLDRIRRHLQGSERFERTEYRPEYAPASLVIDYDLGYFPTAVDRAYLQVRWFENEDFNVHYSEQYESGDRWECRWDRHPNTHNIRAHFHPPPDARTPGEDRSFPTDWRELLAEVLGELDDHIMGFWG